MVIVFPNLETLQRALAQGVVPPELRLAPAGLSVDPDGGLRVRPAVSVSPAVLQRLRGLGVHSEEWDDRPPEQSVQCWAQLIPLRREAMSQPVSGAAVLFEVRSPTQLPRLVREFRRLGAGPARFRWPDEDSDEPVLVRVPRAPLYSLLRAETGDLQAGEVQAYVELAPRLWVEVGYRHPLLAHIAPPDGKLLLLKAPRDWRSLDDVPFLEEIEEFPLPAAATPRAATDCDGPVPIPLRLARGGSDEPAELWVLHDSPAEQLAAFVQTADGQDLSRLWFALAQSEGRQVLVLCLRPERGRGRAGSPPVLQLPGVAFRPYLKLPNLFVPCNHRLLPGLRRDALRDLLAADAGQLTWLFPSGDGRFIVEGLPTRAFRPLREWIDYTVGEGRHSWATWEQDDFLALPSFDSSEEDSDPMSRLLVGRRARGGVPADRVCGPVGATRPGPGLLERVRGLFHKARRWVLRRPLPDAAATTEEALPDAAPPRRSVAVEPPAPISKLEQRCRDLEKRFLDVQGPADANERLALLPELGRLYTTAGNTSDAALCWLNALWEQPQAPPEWAGGWLRAEVRATGRKVTEADLDRLLAITRPTDVRALAAYVVWGAQQDPPLPSLIDHLGWVRNCLEEHETLLPVRGAWLAWLSLTRLSQGDILSLVRTRDRLLERLFHKGLNPDQDLPSFLRFGGLSTSSRFQAVRDWLPRLREPVQRWISRLYLDVQSPPPELTTAYANLTLAWGLARVGEREHSRLLVRKAQEVLGHKDIVHRFLLEAYQFRIRQAENGSPPTPLPDEQLAILNRMDPVDERYKVDWLRRHSRILESELALGPELGEEPGPGGDELAWKLAALAHVSDRAELAAPLAQLLQQADRADTPPRSRARILTRALELAPRMGEAFARHVLERVLPALAKLPRAQDRIELLDAALLLAAHYDQADHVKELVARFQELLGGQRRSWFELTERHWTAFQARNNKPLFPPLVLTRLRALLNQRFPTERDFQRELARILSRKELEAYGPRLAAYARQGAGDVTVLEPLAGRCFRGLRKLVMREQMDRLLGQLDRWVRQDQPLGELRRLPADELLPVWRMLLHAAEGWFYLGHDGRAVAVLDEVRTLLFEGNLPPRDQQRLACAYAASLGQAPVETALPRLEELFARLGGISDRFTTRSHYSLSQLQVIEAVVRAVVHDDFALGSHVRRWLDDEEYLVRRRIHRDMRTLLAEAGM